MIVFHVASIPAVLGAEPPSWIRPAGQALAPYRIPLLLFLSGMLLPHSLSKGLPRYFGGKVRAILWPYLVWNTLTMTLLGDYGSLTNPWMWVGGSFHLWFLAVLGASYLVGPLTRWVPAWLWVLPMVLLSPIPSTNAYGQILWFGAFFFAGAASAALIERWQRRGPALPACLGILMIIYSALVATGEIQHGDEDLRYFVPSLIGIGALLWVAPRLPRIAWIERVGRESIVFYLVHFPAIGVLWLGVRNWDLPWWIVLPLLACAGFGVPAMMTRWSRSILFRWPERQRSRQSREKTHRVARLPGER